MSSRRSIVKSVKLRLCIGGLRSTVRIKATFVSQFFQEYQMYKVESENESYKRCSLWLKRHEGRL